MISLKKYLDQSLKSEVTRQRELSGEIESNFFNRYAIQIIYQTEGKQLLLEHEQYKQFKKSRDLYFKHPENPSIPVKAHYHVVDSKSKQEIYAVNTDGSAHHRANKGFTVPVKQAEELRALGVNIPANNVLESKHLSINESLDFELISLFLIIDEDATYEA